MNWIKLRYDDDIVISFKYDHITGSPLMQKLIGKMLEYTEDVLSRYSDAIAKLAEKARAIAMRYVLTHLAMQHNY